MYRFPIFWVVKRKSSDVGQIRRCSNGNVPCRDSVHLSSECEGEEHPCNVVPINTAIKIHLLWSVTVFSSHIKSRVGNILANCGCFTHYAFFRRGVCSFTNTHSPITLANFSSINIIFIFRCYSSPWNPVYERYVNSSVLVFILSSHRHSYIGLIFSSRFIDS